MVLFTVQEELLKRILMQVRQLEYITWDNHDANVGEKIDMSTWNSMNVQLL